MLGIIYADIEEWDKAIERHKVNVQNRVELMYAYTNLANAYRGKGLYDKAREVLEFYLNHFPGHARIHNDLSLLYIQRSELDLAMIEAEKAFKLDPTDYVNFMRKGDIFLYKGDLIKAEDEYQKLLQATEPIGRAWGAVRLAYLYSLQGRFKKSKSMILQGIDLSRNFGQSVWRSLFLYALAENQRITGHPEESLKECDKTWDSAVEAEYPWVQRMALHSKGLTFVEMNSMTEATEAAHKLKQMIEERLNRREIRLYDHLIGMIELKRRNYAQAIEYFEQAISLLSYGPPTQRADFIASLALACYRAGDLDKSLEEYVRITSLTSGRLEYGDIYAKSFYTIGKIYEQQGNTAKAIEHYEKFLDLWKDADPGIAEVDDARERMVGLKK